MKLGEIINQLNLVFPKKDAAAWDFVGWQIRTKNKNINVNHVLVSLDVTENVIDEAIKNDIKLIIAHHPFIFAKNINALKNNQLKKELYQKLIVNNINVFILHTNFDTSPIGMNFLTAKGLKLKNVKFFDDEKLSVIGQYHNLKLVKIIENVKSYYHFDKVKVISNNLATKINKVLLAPGAGGSIVEILNKSTNVKKDIALIITGEIKWHQELEARDKNINVLILGHEMEEKFVDFVTDFLFDKVFLQDKVEIKKCYPLKAHII